MVVAMVVGTKEHLGRDGDGGKRPPGSAAGSERAVLGAPERLQVSQKPSEGVGIGNFWGMPAFGPPVGLRLPQCCSISSAPMAPPRAKDEVRHSASPDIESLVYDNDHEVGTRLTVKAFEVGSSLTAWATTTNSSLLAAAGIHTKPFRDSWTESDTKYQKALRITSLLSLRHCARCCEWVGVGGILRGQVLPCCLLPSY